MDIGLPDLTIRSSQKFLTDLIPKHLSIFQIKQHREFPLAIMNPEKDWKEELDSFGERLKARKAAEKYAPWHPRNMILHPTRTWRLAFGIVGDNEMERALAHMDSGTAGSKDKPRPKPKQK